jgi:hypothetical protein
MNTTICLHPFLPHTNVPQLLHEVPAFKAIAMTTPIDNLLYRHHLPIKSPLAVIDMPNLNIAISTK